MSRKDFDGVDGPGGTAAAGPTTSLFRAGGFRLPIAPDIEEPVTKGPSLVAPAWENDNRPIRHIANTIVAGCFICRGPFPSHSTYKALSKNSRSAPPDPLYFVNELSANTRLLSPFKDTSVGNISIEGLRATRYSMPATRRRCERVHNIPSRLRLQRTCWLEKWHVSNDR